ncbi:gliding motility-associated-like protein, partial [Flavobacterium arsenatis]
PALDNSATTTYTFTPNSGQCAGSASMTITVNNSTVPTFTQVPSICQGEALSALPVTSNNGIVGTWSPALDNSATTTYTFTPNAGQCAGSANMTITVNNSTVPTFTQVPSICQGETLSALPVTSNNGITGTWSPALDNMATTTYTFTPNSGQCAGSASMTITVNTSVVPSFTSVNPICQGEALSALPVTSNNGITGTWSPALDNMATTTYTFTPNSGQCAGSASMTITVNNSTVPTFTQVPSICQGEALSALPVTSNNGIAGTWSPALDNMATTTYTFTPNAGQCAGSASMTITVNTSVVPTFTQVAPICSGETLSALPVTSNNGITGTWSPAINENVSTVYTFKPNAGQCAATVQMTILVNPLPTPVLKDEFLCINNETGAVLLPKNLNCGLPNTNHSFSWTRDNNPLPTTTNTHLAFVPGVYKVTATNLLTGCSNTATSIVGTSSLAIAEVSVEQDFNRNQTITITVTGGSTNYEFQLDDGIPQESNQFTNIYQGEYEVTIRDKNGCGELVLPVFAMNYPRFFTPNGDGYNDTWSIEGLSQQQDAKIYIFDRYGKLITSINPSQNSSWDGTLNGKQLPSTDYWFTLSYKNRQGTNKEFKAHFSLKR